MFYGIMHPFAKVLAFLRHICLVFSQKRIERLLHSRGRVEYKALPSRILAEPFEIFQEASVKLRALFRRNHRLKPGLCLSGNRHSRKYYYSLSHLMSLYILAISSADSPFLYKNLSLCMFHITLSLFTLPSPNLLSDVHILSLVLPGLTCIFLRLSEN